MAKEVTTTCDEGFVSTSTTGGEEITIDATGEETADTLEHLLATYAACYVPALRVGGQQRGVEDFGKVEIATTGELNDDDKLESVHFEVSVEADVDEEAAAKVVERADELCKVHDALKGELRAETTLSGDAF